MYFLLSAIADCVLCFTDLIKEKTNDPPPVILNLLHCGFRFLSDQRSLPVLWHQSLLTFVQR